MFKRKSIYNQLIYTLIVLCVLNTTTSTINNRIF
jgi:Histidine phosphatase superfamily (branch 2)